MVKATNAAVRLPIGFAGANVPDAWPLPRTGPPAPSASGRRSRRLQGVGPAVARRLARLGLEQVGDLLWQRPWRYEEPVPGRRVCDLFGDEEAVLDVVVQSVSSRRRGARLI